MLKGETRGYKNHPQLCRFKEAADPLAAIAFYLKSIFDEASLRGYRFNRCKIGPMKSIPVPSGLMSAGPMNYVEKLPLTRGQLKYEFYLLCSKLRSRDMERCREMGVVEEIAPHPLFYLTDGDIAPWERAREEIFDKCNVK